MIVVLMVAVGAAWEAPALRVLDDHPGTVVLKRCVDVDDLLAAASAGQAEVAVLALDSRGLDLAAVDHLRAHGVRPVAVVPAGPREAARTRADRIGVATLVGEDEIGRLPEAVTAPDPVRGSAAATRARPRGPRPSAPPGPPPPAGDAVTAGLHSQQEPTRPPAPGGPSAGGEAPGRVVVVWGPTGAPGRSTVAMGLAAESARRGRPTVLVDGDPFGGSLAQQLGVVDEVSGLLAAARLSASGALEEQLHTVLRAVGSDLAVLTGLPRPDRWVEVRPGVVDHVLAIARGRGDVVVDTGFCLEQGDAPYDLGGRPSRHQMTLEALAAADEVVAVGSADPVGLSRLARGLADLRELAPGTAVRVVVNRMRSSLGWTEQQVGAVVAQVSRPVGLVFLPEDRAAVDRAAVAGRSLVESGESALSRALATLTDQVLPGTAPRSVGRGLRRRRAGTGRRR